MFLSILQRTLRQHRQPKRTRISPQRLPRPLDTFRVAVCVMGKWEQLSSHSDQFEAVTKAHELGALVADIPIRITTRAGRVVYELEAH